jgi:Peptidase S24-like
MWRRYSWRTGCLIFASLATVVGVHAANELSDPWIRGVFTGKSPRPVPVAETEAWQRASELAGLTAGAFVLVGSGESMQPLYPPGTILVLRPLPYAALERGQTALYRSKGRKVVAHVLITKASDGWRVAGLNNRIHDMEPVQGENLVGVVIAAFKPLIRGSLFRIASTNH